MQAVEKARDASIAARNLGKQYDRGDILLMWAVKKWIEEGNEYKVKVA